MLARRKVGIATATFMTAIVHLATCTACDMDVKASRAPFRAKVLTAGSDETTASRDLALAIVRVTADRERDAARQQRWALPEKGTIRSICRAGSRITGQIILAAYDFPFVGRLGGGGGPTRQLTRWR